MSSRRSRVGLGLGVVMVIISLQRAERAGDAVARQVMPKVRISGITRTAGAVGLALLQPLAAEPADAGAGALQLWCLHLEPSLAVEIVQRGGRVIQAHFGSASRMASSMTYS